MGLPLRIAIPIFTLFAAIFLGIMGWLLHVGFGATGSAFGPSVAEQGDARIAATPAPIETEPPGTFTVPQTGTGPVMNPSALPGASTGGGPPAPVMQAVQMWRDRLAHNPRDLAALVAMGNLEFEAHRFVQAGAYFRRALALDPTNPDVRTDYATTLHDTGHDLDALAQLNDVLAARPRFAGALFTKGVVLQAIGRRTDSDTAFRTFLSVAAARDPRVATAKAALAQPPG